MKTARRQLAGFGALLALSLCVAGFVPALSFGAIVSNAPRTVLQPDGVPLNLSASGDELFNYEHTKNGSLVMANTAGTFVYATERFDGVLVPGTVRVDEHPLYAGLTIDEVDVKANIQADEMLNDLVDSTQPQYTITGQRLASETTTSGTEVIETTPSGGLTLTKADLTNVVCYIRFAGEPEFASFEVTTDSALLNTNALSLKSYIKA